MTRAAYDMVSRPRHGLSLCAGGGGLDMGLMLAEPGFHTRCFVEWEEYPRSTLIAAQRAGYFDPAPIWDDLTTFDARPFRGAFDTVLAGYPCQPFSHAGQRKGHDDERHLWPDVARVIGEVEPEWVFLENVAGHVSLGLETVLRKLWDMGFTPASGLFTAAETGAPHERERVFVVARRVDNTASPRRADARMGADERRDRIECGQQMLGDRCRDMADAPRLGRGEGWTEPEFRGGRDTPSGASCAVADAGCGRHGGSGERQDQQPRRTETERPSGDVADPGRAGLEGREWRGSHGERHRPAAHGSIAERGRPCLHPPGPADMGGWAGVLIAAPELAPSASFGDLASFASQAAAMAQAGLVAEAQIEPTLRRMADGLAHRARALRLLGNGVHPLAAAYAWRTLAAAHGLRPVDLDAASADQGTDADEPVVRAAE